MNENNKECITALSEYLKVVDYQYTFICELYELVDPDNGLYSNDLRSEILEKLLALKQNQTYLKQQLEIIEENYNDIQRLIDVQYSILHRHIL